MNNIIFLSLFSIVFLSGCMSAYDYDKTTVLTFNFGIGFTFVREKQASIEDNSNTDTVVETPYGNLEVKDKKDASSLQRDSPSSKNR